MGLMSNRYNEWERPKLSNYQLSVGNVQFERNSQMTSTRRNYSKILNDELFGNEKYNLFIDDDEDIYWNCQYYVVSVKNNMNDFVDQMFKKGIHLMKEDVWDCSAYDFSNNISGNFLVAKKYNRTLVRIPNSSFLSKKDILLISNQMISL